MWSEGLCTWRRQGFRAVFYQPPEREAEQTLHCPGLQLASLRGPVMWKPCHVLEVLHPVLHGQEGYAEESKTGPIC